MKKSLIAALAAGGLAIGSLAIGGLSIAQSVSAEDGRTIADPPTAELTNIADDGATLLVQDRERHGRRRGSGDLETAATTIGVSVEDLTAARENGQSIADVATANGVDPAAVVDAMTADAGERLAERVEAGELTQAEADEKLDGLVERISERVFAVRANRQG